MEAGLGIAVVSEAAARLYARTLAVEMVRIEEPWAARRLMICVRDRAALTPPAAAFFSHLARASEKEAKAAAVLAATLRELASSGAKPEASGGEASTLVHIRARPSHVSHWWKAGDSR